VPVRRQKIHEGTSAQPRQSAFVLRATWRLAASKSRFRALEGQGLSGPKPRAGDQARHPLVGRRREGRHLRPSHGLKHRGVAGELERPPEVRGGAGEDRSRGPAPARPPNRTEVGKPEPPHLGQE